MTGIYFQLVRLTFGTRHSKEPRVPIWEAEEGEKGDISANGEVNEAYSGSKSDLDHAESVDPGYSK